MKIRRNTRVTNLVSFALLGALLLLAGCAPAAEEPATLEPVPTAQPEEEEVSETLTFVDDLGRTITLDAYPERIVSTSPSLTEMLFAVGAGDTLTGRDDFSVYPEAALAVPSFGSLFADFPAETILGMEPDLVLAAEIIPAEQVQAMEELGLVVYWQANPTSFEGLFENINDLAALVGKTENAEALIADLDARVKAVQELAAGAETTPVVFYELDATDPSNPWTA